MTVRQTIAETLPLLISGIGQYEQDKEKRAKSVADVWPTADQIHGDEMKDCTNCKFADWERTSAGKLHPSGNGQCKYQWVLPALPASMYWIGSGPSLPSGGYINRKKELKENCVYFNRV